jgi:hypothetical protein
MAEILITKEYLRSNPDRIFVFGDNTLRIGKGGAAVLRDEPNTYGFITKKQPDNLDTSFFKPEEYKDVYSYEKNKLIKLIEIHTDKIFMISKLGAGLANKYNIFETIIEKDIKSLSIYANVEFLFYKNKGLNKK